MCVSWAWAQSYKPNDFIDDLVTHIWILFHIIIIFRLSSISHITSQQNRKHKTASQFNPIRSDPNSIPTTATHQTHIVVFPWINSFIMQSKQKHVLFIQRAKSFIYINVIFQIPNYSVNMYVQSDQYQHSIGRVSSLVK